MIPLSGFVYFDKEFIFEDGDVGEKLFVILCPSPCHKDCVLVARTTSQPKASEDYGCHSLNENGNVFFISPEDSGFDDPTWIQFDYVMMYMEDILKRWERKFELSIEQLKSLLQCGSESDLLSIWQKDALKEYSDMLKI